MLSLSSAYQIASTDTGYGVVLLSPLKILQHEEFDPCHVLALRARILADGAIRRPLAVERGSLVLLDGHHRLAAAISLGLRFVPCALIDYADPRIEVLSWRADVEVTGAMVVGYARAGRLMPKKTSRHIFTPDLGEAAVSLAVLNGDAEFSQRRTRARVPSR